MTKREIKEQKNSYVKLYKKNQTQLHDDDV